jgi:hypothetical protein
MCKSKSKIGKDGLDSYEREFINGAGRNSSILYYNNDLYYQGSYEKDFLDKVNEQNKISKIKRGARFSYSINGKKRQYRSDFLYENIIFEIKSSWTYGKTNVEKREKNHIKFKSVLENGYRLIIILDKNFYIEITNNNIGKNLYNEKLKNIKTLKL